jgi:hypothetical protein
MTSARPDPERLIGKLVGPEGPELTCDECFDQLDLYVELELAEAEADADEQVPGMRAHLDGCPACGEDHQSLLAFVAGDELHRPRPTSRDDGEDVVD